MDELAYGGLVIFSQHFLAGHGWVWLGVAGDWRSYNKWLTHLGCPSSVTFLVPASLHTRLLKALRLKPRMSAYPAQPFLSAATGGGAEASEFDDVSLVSMDPRSNWLV